MRKKTSGQSNCFVRHRFAKRIYNCSKKLIFALLFASIELSLIRRVLKLKKTNVQKTQSEEEKDGKKKEWAHRKVWHVCAGKGIHIHHYDAS